jgi:hypothetical protein
MGFLDKISKLFTKNNEVEANNDDWKPIYESKYNGFVGLYNLDEWWEKEFTEDQREYIIANRPEVTEDEFRYSDKSPAQCLQELSLWFTSKEDSDILLKLLNKAEKFVDDKKRFTFYI